MSHFPSQPWSKETKCSGFEESVGDLNNDQDSAKMPDKWITNTISGRRSTMMVASATPLKFSGKHTTVTTVSWVPRKHKSADDDKMQADSLKKGDPGSWTSKSGNELAGVSDEVAQEFQVISNGNANIEGPR